MEEKQNSVNESNAAKRLRLLGENMDEKIHSEEDEIKKGNFWQNLWSLDAVLDSWCRCLYALSQAMGTVLA